MLKTQLTDNQTSNYLSLYKRNSPSTYKIIVKPMKKTPVNQVSIQWSRTYNFERVFNKEAA